MLLRRYRCSKVHQLKTIITITAPFRASSLNSFGLFLLVAKQVLWLRSRHRRQRWLILALVV
jgi:hypothetical protein